MSKIILVVVGIGLSLASCYMKTEHKIEAHITIDIRELKETATQIEDMVRSKKGKGGQSLFRFWKAGVAYGEMQLKVMTPQVQKAVDRRGARLDRLEELMLKGCIGENNCGYVAYRPCPACDSDPELLKEVEKLIKEENQDRKTIYETVIAQNNLTIDALAVVEKAFSYVQRKNAPIDSFVQEDDGIWIKKVKK